MLDHALTLNMDFYLNDEESNKVTNNSVAYHHIKIKFEEGIIKVE